MMDRQIEDKKVGFTVESAVQYNSPIGPADCRALVPAITPIDSNVGNTTQQRIGDRIKPKSLKVRGIVSLQGTAQTTTQALYARVLILAQKDVKVASQVNAGTVDTAHLLAPDYVGVGTDQQPFNGNTADIIRPINTDKFRVYMDKIFKFTPNVYPNAVEMTGQAAKWSYTFKSDKLPASLTFDAGNINSPNNFAPFVAIGYAYADGTSPDTIVRKIVTHTESLFVFEDA